MLDFSQKKPCMQAGMDAARKMIPRIRLAIEEWKRRRAAGGAPRS
jgi:NTE family protein